MTEGVTWKEIAQPLATEEDSFNGFALRGRLPAMGCTPWPYPWWSAQQPSRSLGIYPALEM